MQNKIIEVVAFIAIVMIGFSTLVICLSSFEQALKFSIGSSAVLVLFLTIFNSQTQ